MVSRVWLRVYHLLSREDACFFTSLSRYSHLISASGNPRLLSSVSPITAASELVHPAPITKHPRSGEPPRGVIHSSPRSATSWIVPGLCPRLLPSSEKQDIHCRLQTSSSCCCRQERLVDRCPYPGPRCMVQPGQSSGVSRCLTRTEPWRPVVVEGCCLFWLEPFDETLEVSEVSLGQSLPGMLTDAHPGPDEALEPLSP